MASPGGKLSSEARLMRNGDRFQFEVQSDKKYIFQAGTFFTNCLQICCMSPFLIRPGLRRATFPPGEGVGTQSAFMEGKSVW